MDRCLLDHSSVGSFILLYICPFIFPSIHPCFQWTVERWLHCQQELPPNPSREWLLELLPVYLILPWRTIILSAPALELFFHVCSFPPPPRSNISAASLTTETGLIHWIPTLFLTWNVPYRAEHKVGAQYALLNKLFGLCYASMQQTNVNVWSSSDLVITKWAGSDHLIHGRKEELGWLQLSVRASLRRRPELGVERWAGIRGAEGRRQAFQGWDGGHSLRNGLKEESGWGWEGPGKQ